MLSLQLDEWLSSKHFWLTPSTWYFIGTNWCCILTLRSSPRWGLTVPSQSINQFACLLPNTQLTLREKLQMLDVSRVLLYYMDRTKLIILSPHLFLAIAIHSKGQATLSYLISKWIMQHIFLCCQLAAVPLPLNIKAHTTRAQATSSACIRNVPNSEICKVATHSNPLTFVKHYGLDLATRADAKFGRAVQQSLFSWCSW